MRIPADEITAIKKIKKVTFKRLSLSCHLSSGCREEAYSILFDLGISEYVHRWVAEISGGEKQRVCTARAILQDPCIYFADEPVSQLDAYLTGRVLGLLKAETVEKAKTVFCVIHDASLIQRFADRVLSFNREHPDQWHLRDAHHS